MINVIKTVRDKMKLKLIETSFSLGISTDQITPYEHKVVFTHFVGYVIDNSKPVDTASIHKKPVNPDKLYKPNYNKRASFKK